MLFLALVGMTLLCNPSAYANEKGKHGSGEENCRRGGNQCPVAGKLEMKSHFLLEHKADLALTDDQVKTIKDIKLQAEKDGAQQEADGKVFMIGLKTKLHEDKIDVDGANALIDKSFASMQASVKSSVASYARLQSLLTPEQAAKVKEIWKNKKGSWKHEEHEKEGHDDKKN